MSILVSAHKISKSFATKNLFADLSLTIEDRDRIGLIGPNGAGKSTLLKILAQETEADNGDLSFTRGLAVGYLRQVPEFGANATILQTIQESISDPEDWDKIGLAHEYFSRFELDQFGEETSVASLSGGWKKRVALARELVKRPDLLLLDEPTNHLDIEGILWLENFLSRASFAVVTITHDRFFLQKVANRIVELDKRHEGGLLNVRGNYSDYLEVREKMIADQENQELVLKNTLRRETEWLRQGAKARTTKQKARIERAGNLKDVVSELVERNVNRTAKIDFQAIERNPKILIEAKNITKSYGDLNVFTKFDLVVGRRSRLGLLGTNGSGKSTLIRVLIGDESPTSGEVTRSERLQIAYFDQIRESLDPTLTVAQTLSPDSDHVQFCGRSLHLRSYLDRFLFTKEQFDMPVEKLSGGEQSRLLIAKLMLREANLLVLDEPTNDLDMATLNVLEDCLAEFPGAVILVTHDRYFLDRVANQLIAFPPPSSSTEARLEFFAELAQWESWRTQQAKQPKAVSASANLGKEEAIGAGSSNSGKSKKKLSYMDERELQGMEASILSAETDLSDIIAQSEDPQNSTNATLLLDLSARMAVAQAKVDQLYKRWAELEQLKE